MDKKLKFVINDNGHCRLCTQKDDVQDMVSCDDCDRWFHYGCAGLSRLPTKAEPWFCIRCADSRNERNELETKIEEMIKLMEKKNIEIEARAKQNKSSQVHLNAIEAELEHYKEIVSKQDKQESSKQDVLLTLASILQKK